MMRKFSLVLLVWLASLAHAEDEKLLVVESAKELKGVTEKKIIWKKDGAKMVLIPANPPSPGNRADAFLMDVHEVSVGQFKKFLKSSDYKPDNPINWNKIYKYSPDDNHPIIYVTWRDATAYCKWASKRLPSHEEWEWAARGGLVGKKYSWGDDENLARDYANCRGTGGKDKWDEQTAPVGSLKPNGYGLFDMAGNVSEFCADSGATFFEFEWVWDMIAPKKLPTKLSRGGFWYNDAEYLLLGPGDGLKMSSFFRHSGGGFRCVADLK